MNYVPVQNYTLHCLGIDQNRELTLMVPVPLAVRLVKAGLIEVRPNANPPLVVMDDAVDEMLIVAPGVWIEKGGPRDTDVSMRRG